MHFDRKAKHYCKIHNFSLFETQICWHYTFLQEKLNKHCKWCVRVAPSSCNKFEVQCFWTQLFKSTLRRARFLAFWEGAKTQQTGANRIILYQNWIGRTCNVKPFLCWAYVVRLGIAQKYHYFPPNMMPQSVSPQSIDKLLALPRSVLFFHLFLQQNGSQIHLDQVTVNLDQACPIILRQFAGCAITAWYIFHILSHSFISQRTKGLETQMTHKVWLSQLLGIGFVALHSDHVLDPFLNGVDRFKRNLP